MGLRFDPVGGGQFKQAVQQLIEIESQPIKAMQTRKGKEDARMKLFQEFKGKFGGLDKALTEISSFRKFRELKADLGDGASLASITIDKDRAEPGQYDLEINQLATRTSLISNGFESPSETAFGTGFLSLEMEDGSNRQIMISEKNSSLAGISALLNRDPNSPLRAAVIKDAAAPDAPWKLVLSAKKEGSENQISSVEFNFDEAGPDLSIDDNRDAQNGTYSIDNFPIETASNDINDFLPGVNLHLKQARPDQPFTLMITEDYQKSAGKVKGLVEQMNQILNFIVKQNTIDDKTDTSTTFAGDTSLQSIEYQLRNAIHAGYPGGVNKDGDPKLVHMTELGIEFDKAGSLSFKEEKFNKFLEQDFDSIAEAIAGPNGMASKLRKTLDGYLRGGNGMLSIKEQGIRDRIKQIDEQIENKTRSVDSKKQHIVEQFARLESSLGSLQRQQQQVSATMGGGGGGGTVSQLLGG